MRIVKIKGGLGNQMFQYAFSKLIEKKTGDTVKLDYSAYEYLKGDIVRNPRIKKFNLTLSDASEKDIISVCKFIHIGNPLSFWYKVKVYLESKINKNYFFETDRAYINPNTILNFKYYDGYWQSYKYVDKVIDEIINDFKPLNKISEKTKKTKEIMQSQNSVFVGVRKGDYAKEAAHYGSFDSYYYKKAMEVINLKVKNPIFYVFSNDINWCKRNIDWGNYEIIYREPEDQTDDFEELILMSSCKHAIIVNSTYHWWGAALIQNTDKIICCPNKWFFDGAPIDIIPANWTKI